MGGFLIVCVRFFLFVAVSTHYLISVNVLRFESDVSAAFKASNFRWIRVCLVF